VPAEGLAVTLQEADVTVPPSSHPHDVLEVTVRVLMFCPLF
jgi:hypothetical protein